MNENKIIVAILTITPSAWESRGASKEVGKENWHRVFQHYQQIVAELEHDPANASELNRRK